MTTFDVPGSAYTQAGRINPAGAITGYYISNGLFHGFLRAPDGIFTSIDPPGSVYSGAYGINPAGAITGLYLDASGNTHGFLLTPQ